MKATVSKVAAGRDGMAVLTAILIVTASASAATLIFMSTDSALNHSETASARAQADAIAVPALLWIAKDPSSGGQAQFISVEGGSIKWRVEDVQGGLNLNGVAPGGVVIAANLEAFRRLLTVTGLDSAMAESLGDWLDSDTDERPDGAEDGHYQSLESPYLCGNALLSDVDDVALIKGFSAKAIDALKGKICALPRPAPINVNSASAGTLAAVIGGISGEDAEYIVKARGKSGFQTIDDFKRLLPEKASLPQSGVSLKSEFFKIRLTAKFEKVAAHYLALVEAGNPDANPKIIWLKAD